MGAPITAILDAFNRADENPLAGNWTQGIGVDEGVNLRLSSQRVINGAAFDVCSAYWNLTTFAANQEAYITVAAFDSSPGTRLYVRIANPGAFNVTGYYCTYTGVAGTVALARLDEGTPVGIGSQIVGTGYTKILLNATGSTLTVSGYTTEGGWTTLLTATDATYNTAGSIGFGINSTTNAPGVALDDFGGGDSNIALTGVTIAGDTSAAANVNVTLTATIAPTDATTPITYTWSTTGLQSGQGTATGVYQFGAAYAGTSVTVSIAAANVSGSATDTHVIAIYDTLARGQICSIVGGVTTTGNVYCYKRHLLLREKLVDLFQATIGGVDVLRGFDMELRSIAQERKEFNAGLLRTYNFVIYGYFAWQDPSADPQHSAVPSEEVAASVVLEVVNALDTAATLHTSTYHYDCSKAQVTALEPWVWCNELVHRATITISVTDFINQ